MNLSKSPALAVFLFFLVFQSISAQTIQWTSLGESTPSKAGETPAIEAKTAHYFSVGNLPQGDELDETMTIGIPFPDGSVRSFTLVANTTMHSDLAAQFPGIRSYNATANDGSGYRGKVDISHKGIHAILLHPMGSTLFLDPVYLNDSSIYIAYSKANFQTEKIMSCMADHNEEVEKISGPKSGSSFNSCELRTYRLAMAATGEYTIFHGGTVADALAAINTTMNRVNGIYERDFAVTMTLIPNTNLLIYTSPSTDPYSNGQAGVMLNQNQANVNSVIGPANYDIGHVFGTNSGGIAGLGVTCTNSSKARGVTGSSAPIGDPFDVDYVAHEIGHQFGGTHTFNNSCNGNRTNATAVEPGSGSTIMAYAGICAPNVQSNSDDHFHGVSMQQVGARITADNCPAVTSLDNLAPVIDSLTTGIVVPSQTPFALTAFAGDPDPNDVLTYNWEQIDNEITTQPPLSTSDEGPNFRSFSPTANPTQYFPRLESLASPSPETWEVLSSVERTMSFRCTVKDNAEGGGCAQYDDATITISDAAGPFVVSQPSVSGITWEAFTQEEVTWDVANTDLPPISCQFVDIFLSVDGGITYPEVLAEGVPNTGSAIVDVPNFTTNDARVMVMNEGGTFFDVSNNDFTINGIQNGYLIVADQPEQSTCIGGELTYNLSIEGFGDFNESISLSLAGDLAEVDADLADDILNVGEETSLSITNTSDLDPGVLNVIVLGTAPSFDQSLSVVAGFNAIETEIPTPVAPENGAEFVPTTTILDWDASPSPDAVYTVEISTTEDFSTDVITLQSIGASELMVEALNDATTYYWRVNKDTPCSEPEFSDVFSFLTHSCFPFAAEDVPADISPVPGQTTSVISIPYEGIVEDVNITSLQATHGDLGQISAKLVGPSGTEVILFESICDNTQDLDIAFDDAAPSGVVECPANNGEVYEPVEALSAFIGESTQGDWVLVITDDVSGGGGSLDLWSLEVCVGNAGTFQITSNDTDIILCQGEATTLEVTAEEVFFFENAIDLSGNNLPEGVTISFSPETIFPGETSTVTFELSEDAIPGAYTPFIVGVSDNVSDDLEIPAGINSAQPESPELESPTEGEETTGFAEFIWSEVPSPNAQYELQIGFDQDFTELYLSESGLTDTDFSVEGLPASALLYWRVIVDNGCDEAISETRSFSTQACGSIEPESGVPFNISPVANDYVSEIEVPLSGVIEGIRIPYITGTHFRVSDLEMSLESPSGTEVLLFSAICEDSNDFDLGFVEGGEPDVNCPPTDGLLYAPAESFTAFEGEDPQGAWLLKISDSVSGGGGQFTAWALEICYSENVFSTSNIDPDAFSLYPNPALEEIFIEIPQGIEVTNVSVFDVTGRLIEGKGNLSEDIFSVNVSAYTEGLYLIRLSGDFGSVTKRFVKED